MHIDVKVEKAWICSVCSLKNKETSLECQGCFHFRSKGQPLEVVKVDGNDPKDETNGNIKVNENDEEENNTDFEHKKNSSRRRSRRDKQQQRSYQVPESDDENFLKQMELPITV